MRARVGVDSTVRRPHPLTPTPITGAISSPARAWSGQVTLTLTLTLTLTGVRHQLEHGAVAVVVLLDADGHVGVDGEQRRAREAEVVDGLVRVWVGG